MVDIPVLDRILNSRCATLKNVQVQFCLSFYLSLSQCSEQVFNWRKCCVWLWYFLWKKLICSWLCVERVEQLAELQCHLRRRLADENQESGRRTTRRQDLHWKSSGLEIVQWQALSGQGISFFLLMFRTNRNQRKFPNSTWLKLAVRITKTNAKPFLPIWFGSGFTQESGSLPVVIYWRKCLVVDCVWKEWSEWEHCNTICGDGWTQRTRIEQPALHGGNPCTGSKKERKECFLKQCPSKEWSEMIGNFLFFCEATIKPCTGHHCIKIFPFLIHFGTFFDSLNTQDFDCKLTALNSSWGVWNWETGPKSLQFVSCLQSIPLVSLWTTNKCLSHCHCQ